MSQDIFAQRKIVDQFLQKTGFELSSYSFINIFAWQDFFDFEFQVIDERLLVFAGNDLGSFLYLPPLGKGISRECVDTCFRILNEKNNGKGVGRIENVEEKDLGLFGEKDFVRFEKSRETVYSRCDIANLQGNRFKSKRSSYNHFVKNYKFEFCPYRDSMKKNCFLLYDQWTKKRKKRNSDEIYQQMIDESGVALRRCLNNFQNLGLIGCVVFVEGRIVGYSFGFALKQDVFCILFEIADLEMKGLSTYLFSEFCKMKAVESFNFINVMDDFSLDNVRSTKLSFKPAKQIKTYTISQKD
ncbi:MAG: phosphatidylglycerol lysyltransferase domain-containing protein [Candidatus Omnitrophica bacterium]|nr:phosphatidylglycerol lysyltransferase domain-containing protein [Candidatus Omnitrophota bacterium]